MTRCALHCIWCKYSYPAAFEPGGTDSISLSLLDLVGLSIPSTANQIAPPVSHFLGLLGVLRQPGKSQEGMQSMVSLLAPDTTEQVSPYCLAMTWKNSFTSSVNLPVEEFHLLRQ